MMVVFVLELIRKERLTFKYAFAWLGVGALLVFFAVFDGLLYQLAYALGFQLPSNFIFFSLSGVFVVLSFLMTVFLCQQNERNDSMAQKIGILEFEIRQLKEELELLKNAKRREVAERLKEAISYGDLSENSEYEEAKNEQAFVEGRIAELEEKVKYAKIIKEKSDVKTVQIGTKVVIKDIGRKTAEKEEYTIVGSTEADPLDHKISNESPVGAALLDQKKGDIVKVITPNGATEYEIMNLE